MLQLTRMNRILSIAVVVATVSLTAAWGTSSSEARGVASNGTLTKANAALPVLNSNHQWGDADWVATLDPAEASDSTSLANIWLTNGNLVKLDWPSLRPIPDLATWTMSPNRKVYTFHIRPNARFSNGDYVTAQDAAWSITRALLPATKSPVATIYLSEIVGAGAVAAGKATTLAGAKVINPHTLQITIKDAIPYFLGTLAYSTADVLDPKVMQGKAPNSYLTNTCSGNVGPGPFEFVCQNKGSGRASFYPSGHSPFMDYQPNPYYYGRKPRIRIHAPFIADTQTNWRLFQSGAVDDTVVPSADLAVARRTKNFFQEPALETDYITPNSQSPPFNNINCRLAVAYAIDRVGITEKLLKGTEYPLYDVLPQGLPNGGEGYFGLEKDVPYYNPARAKAYLNRCPGRLQNVTLDFQNTSQDLVHEYDTVRADLAAIGANITLKPLSFNAWLNVVAGTPMTKTHTQIAENLWIDDYPDAQDWLENLLKTGGFDNIGGYHNVRFDRLVASGNVAKNPANRASLYRQAQKLVLNQGGWIGVGGVDSVFVVRPKVHGIVIASGLVQPLHNDWANVSISG